MSHYDQLILGSSPNALTAAVYLARAGQRVLVLEPTAQIGGAAATSHFASDFRGDQGLLAGRLDAAIVTELGLAQHGLQPIERNSLTSLLPNGRSFTLPADREAAADVIRSFAPNDAPRYGRFMALLDLAADLLHHAYQMAPPPGHHPDVSECAQWLALAGQLAGYGRREMGELLRLPFLSLRDLLDEWFENAELKGLLASAGVRGLFQGPFAPGTTFNLLHHLAIGDGYFRATARGGVGAISHALTQAAQAHGAQLRTQVGPLQVVIQEGVATGVQLANRETISASHVISDFDTRHTFTQLAPPPELEPEFNRAVRQIRYQGAVARINLALAALPTFPGLEPHALRGALAIAPSVSQIERAFDAAKYGQLAARPLLEVTIPSLADPALAPAGQHVLSVWLQYAPYRNNLPAEQLLEAALSALSEHAPDLRPLVLHHQVTRPQEFAAHFGLSEGHLYGGEINLAQAFFLRPLPGYAAYRTPIEHLSLCGAATHPGGGVHGLGGRNLVRAMVNGE
jgi:phytoene dehydrogenase-like protein